MQPIRGDKRLEVFRTREEVKRASRRCEPTNPRLAAEEKIGDRPALIDRWYITPAEWPEKEVKKLRKFIERKLGSLLFNLVGEARILVNANKIKKVKDRVREGGGL